MRFERKKTNQVLDCHKNMILQEDGSVHAMYEIPFSVVSATDKKGKVETKNALQNVLKDLIVQRHGKILCLPLDTKLDKKFESLIPDLAEDTFPLAAYLLEGTYQNLQEDLGEIYSYHNFMVVPLVDNYISSDLRASAKHFGRNIRKEILNLFRAEVAFSTNWYEEYEELEAEVHQKLNLLGGIALTQKQSMLIHRLQYLRGIPYDEDFEQHLIENSIQNLDEVLFKYGYDGIVRVRYNGKESYFKSLPIAKIPDVVNQIHFVEALETLKFPVEILTNYYYNKQKGTFSLTHKARRARNRLGQNQEEAAERGSQQKGSIGSSVVMLDDLESRSDANETFLSYLMTLVITGQSREEIKTKEDALMQFLKAFRIELSPAIADQYYLFHKNLIGTPLETTDENWIQPTSLDGFCENLYFVTQKVGTETGFYLGRVDSQLASWSGDYERAIASSNQLVFSNLLLANKLNIKGKVTSNAATAIVGQTGGGKSFLTKLLFTQTSLQKSQVLYIDPKAEMRAQYQKILKEYEEQAIYPEIQDYIRQIAFITLDARDKKNWGVLDPIVFLKDTKEAKGLAESMILQVLPEKFDHEDFRSALYDSLDATIKERQKGKQVGLLTVLKRIVNRKDKAAKTANLLIKMLDQSILSLACSEGENPALSFDNRVTVLEVTGLDLPQETARTNDPLTTEQTKSLALMYALGRFCIWFGKRDKTQETATFFDEAWFFTSTSIGRAILKEMKRIGRSFNNFLVLITQSIQDLKDANDETSFGNVFAFLEPNEVEEVLNYLKIPVTKASLAMMANMTMGQCVYKDVFGRTARLTVDGMFPELMKLFDTVETKLQVA